MPRAVQVTRNDDYVDVTLQVASGLTRFADSEEAASETFDRLLIGEVIAFGIADETVHRSTAVRSLNAVFEIALCAAHHTECDGYVAVTLRVASGLTRFADSEEAASEIFDRLLIPV